MATKTRIETIQCLFGNGRVYNDAVHCSFACWTGTHSLPLHTVVGNLGNNYAILYCEDGMIAIALAQNEVFDFTKPMYFTDKAVEQLLKNIQLGIELQAGRVKELLGEKS